MPVLLICERFLVRFFAEKIAFVHLGNRIRRKAELGKDVIVILARAWGSAPYAPGVVRKVGNNLHARYLMHAIDGRPCLDNTSRLVMGIGRGLLVVHQT